MHCDSVRSSMALRMVLLRSTGRKMMSGLLGLRWSHGAAIPGPLDGIMERNMIISPPLVLPEDEDSNNNRNIGFGGSMELMAVPKRKVFILSYSYKSYFILFKFLSSGLSTVQVSPHKRGIRNGPKALKPTPVIVRCK